MADTATETLPPVEETAPGADINSPTGANGLFLVCKTDGFAEFYDPKTLARTDEIKLPDFPHEVVLSPDRATAYVSIYGNSQVGTNTRPGTQIAVIDLASRKLTGFIELAPYLAPHGMMFDRKGNLWATAELSNGIVVVDPKRAIVVGGVQLGSHRTHFLAVAPDGNRVYQASSARPLVSIVDPRTDQVAGSVMVEGLGDFPPQLVRLKVSPDNRWWVVAYNVSRKAAVLETRDLKRQFLFELERGPMGIAFPDRATAFVTNHHAGSVTILDLAAMKPVGRFATHIGAESMAFY